MADVIYDEFWTKVANGTIDLAAHSFKMALLKATHTPNQVNAFWSNVSADECTGTGYTATGQVLTGVTVTESPTGVMKWTCDAVVWTNVTVDARYAVIYSDTAASDPLCCLKDFVTTQSPAAVNFTVTPNALGLITATPA